MIILGFNEACTSIGVIEIIIGMELWLDYSSKYKINNLKLHSLS